MRNGVIFLALLASFSGLSVNADESYSEACQPVKNCSCHFQKRIPFGSCRCRTYYPCSSLFIKSRVYALPDDEPLWVGQRDDDFVDALTR